MRVPQVYSHSKFAVFKSGFGEPVVTRAAQQPLRDGTRGKLEQAYVGFPEKNRSRAVQVGRYIGPSGNESLILYAEPGITVPR